MELYERIKLLRKSKLNMTQQDFADAINISRPNIGNIEIGRVAITDRVINDICRVFDVNESWLRTGEGEIFQELSPDEELAAFFGDVMHDETDTFKKRFFTMLSKLEESDWEVLEKMAENMKKG